MVMNNLLNINFFEGIPFYVINNQPLNGTTFLRVKFDLSGLDENLKKYLELFSL